MISENFAREEFECKCGCGYDTVDVELVGLLEDIRDYFARPIIISSGCRCPTHNANVGGTKSSQHLRGKAADIIVKGVSPKDVVAYLNKTYPRCYGVGLYSRWVHVDVRSSKARW